VKIKDTKLGQWLKNKAPKILEVVADAIPGKGIIDIVAGLVSKDETIPEADRLEFKKMEMDFELEMTQMYLTDVAGSRDANVRIQESDKASWLAKNVGYIIDITVIYGFLAMFLVIIYRAVPEANKELFYMAFGSLATFAGTSINWHRGSSQGSAEKQKFLDKVFRR
jgi:hypothetical protein